MNTVCLDFPGRRLAEKPRMPKRLECLTENVMRQPDSLTDRQPDKNALRQSDKDKFLTQVGKICRILSTSTMGSACLRALQLSDGKSGSPHPSVHPGVCIKMTERQAVQGEAPQLTYSPPRGETRASVLLKFKL